MKPVKMIGVVTTPRPAREGLHLLGWCKDVNRAIQQLRDRMIMVGGGTSSGGGGEGNGICEFGEIYVADGNTYIRGGVIFCGDKNFNVDGNQLDLGTDGEWLISVKLSGIDPATDDDDEIFLPGVLTASGTPAWHSKEFTTGTNYDDNTNPATPASTGSVVIPVGKLVIDTGAATLTPVACGNVTIGQCAGILSIARV